MSNILIALAALSGVQTATPAAPAPAPAAAARTLASVPGVTISYYDVPGKTGPEIQKALQAIQASNTKPTTRWDVQAGIKKRVEGTACTILSADARMTAQVNLLRQSGSLPNYRAAPVDLGLTYSVRLH